MNALNCAVDFQNKINKRNKSIEAEVQLKFRLGINIGDVMKKEGITTMVEIGPGNVLSGLAKRSMKGTMTSQISNASDLGY